MGTIVGRYVMPHTVNTVPKLGKDLVNQATATVSACQSIAREIAQTKPDTVIVISAHAPSVGNFFYVPNRKSHFGNMIEYNRLAGFMKFKNNNEFVTDFMVRSQRKDVPVATFEADGRTRRRNRLNGRLDMGTYIPLWFITQEYSDFKLVVISLSDLKPEKHYECGKMIARTVKEAKGTFAIVASAELSHKTTEDSPFGYEPAAMAFNQTVVTAFKEADAKKLMGFDYKKRRKMAQCGVDALNMLLGTCDGYATKGNVLSYEHPFGVGIMTGSLSVSNRASGSALADAEKKASRAKALKREGESAPVLLARKAMDLYLQDETTLEDPEMPEDTQLGSPSGVFVSLYKNGKWRGFYGNPDPTENSAVHDIIDYAITAAVENGIGKVERSELSDIDIVVELVNDDIERVWSLNDFDVTKYGMIVKYRKTEGIIVANAPGIDSVEQQYKAALTNAGANEKDKVRMYRFTTTRFE